MKPILMVTNTLGYFGEINGVVTTYLNMIPEFKKLNVPIHFLTYGPENKIEKEGSVIIETWKTDIPVRIDPELTVDAGLAFLSRFPIGERTKRLAKTEFSAVYSGTPCPLGWVAVGIARRQDLPLITTFHTQLTDYAKTRVASVSKTAGKIAGKTMSKLLRSFYNRSDLILAPTISIKEFCEENFTPDTEILGRGINTDNFNPKWRTKKEGLPEAVYVGRVAPEKNLDTLVKAFTPLLPDKAKLTIVGEGPSRKYLEKKLPDALFTGTLRGEDLYRAYANADFFVFPSETDTFGNVVREAMASGLPAIVTDKMGPKELVLHGINGLITKDPLDFADACRWLVEKDDLREKMGANALEEAQKHTWEDTVKGLIQLVNKIEHSKTYRAPVYQPTHGGVQTYT